MGLLLTLLTLPVSGPLRGTLWIAEQVAAAAELEYDDEGDIRRRLAELERRFAAGELSEDEFEAGSDELFERLLEARALRARQGLEPAPEEFPRE